MLSRTLLSKSAKLALGGTAIVSNAALGIFWWNNRSISQSVQAQEQQLKAVALLRGEPGYEQISGVVRFTQSSQDRVLIEAEVKGLSKGRHGFHIHAFGDLSQGCTSAGPHYNPFNKSHGGPTDIERHVGDLGNIESISETSTSVVKLEDKQIKLDGPTSIIGRAVVLHINEDDHGKGGFPDSLTTGHAGARIACGVVGRSN